MKQVLARYQSLRSHINEPLPNYGFDAPALFAAVNHNNREMVDVLLDAGANINERTRWWAGSFGVLDSAYSELSSYLISRGGLVDVHAAARRSQLVQGEELRLVLANLLRSQAIGRAVEVLGKALDEANVTLCGSLRVMTSLEFFQHHFAQMGHRDTSL